MVTACLLAWSLSAAPLFEEQSLWESGADGYHTYRIPSLLVTKDGSVLAFCEGRKTGGGDHGDIDLLVKRSTDGGRTWSAHSIVYEEGGDAKITIGNPCPVVDQSTGTIWMPLCRDNKRVLITQSDDDGRTWSKPRDVSADVVGKDWVWVATGPGIGIQLQTGPHKGRLVIPSDHRRTLADKSSEWNSHMMYSDDHGATWKIGKPIQAGGNECQVVERADGSLLVNTRMQGHFQGLRGLATSTDGGETFTPIAHEKQLPCPKCQGGMIRLSAAEPNRLGPLLVSNPFPPPTDDPKKPSGARVRLTLRISDDDGRTWSAGRRLYEGPSAYSCLAELADGTMLCIYEGGEKSAYSRLRLARFNRAWLANEVVQTSTDDRRAKQAAADAKLDRTTIIYDGVTPNKMVCDTTLRRLPNGEWVLFFLAGGDTEPSPLNYTAVARSTDEGRTWSQAEAYDTSFPREGTTIGQGPTELMIRDGECTLFFSTHAKHWNTGWRSWIRRSADSGRTWSKPEPAPGRLQDRTFLRNHIVCRDGRIMVPFQHYIGPASEQHLPPLERKFTNPRNGVIVSRDGGRTWSEHGNIRLTDNDQYFGWAENNIVELADGRIAMIIRGDRLGGVLYYAESTDGGVTWPEAAVKTDVPNPGSKATLYGLGGDVVAMLHNPNPTHRSPMALWISFDGMKTWPYRRVLQSESCDGPKGRMNYPDGFVSADKEYLYFAFDDNRHRAVFYAAKLPKLAE